MKDITHKPARNVVDYEEYGGVPLLGVNGISMIAHGRSNAQAVTSAIRIANDFSNLHINLKIVEELAAL